MSGEINHNFIPDLTQDASEPIVSQVLDQLHSQESPTPLINDQWDTLPPQLRRFISQQAFELAPDDLSLRGKVIRGLVGLVAISAQTTLAHELDSMLTTS